MRRFDQPIRSGQRPSGGAARVGPGSAPKGSNRRREMPPRRTLLCLAAALGLAAAPAPTRDAAFTEDYNRGQAAIADVHCDLCKLMLEDLATVAVPVRRKLQADGVAPGAQLAETTTSTVLGLCGEQKRILGVYALHDCEEEDSAALPEACALELRQRLHGRTPQRYAVARYEIIDAEAMEMRTDPATVRPWEAAAHTVMCAKYWTELAEDMGEIVAFTEDSGGNMNSALEDGERFCIENGLCSKPKRRKGKKGKKRQQAAEATKASDWSVLHG